MSQLLGWLSVIGSYLLSNILPVVIILLGGTLIIHIVTLSVTKLLQKTKLEKAAHSLIRAVIRVTLFILLGLIAASRLGIDVTSVVALASVLTLAVSLALQNILANVIGGFTLLSTRPFHSGDYVEIAGQSGTVEEINMTYTVLATPDNKRVSIPNNAVVSAQIINYSVTGTRRISLDINASYDVPTQNVIDALLLAGTVDKALLQPAPFAALSSYDESSIHYVLRVWVKTEDYWDVYYQITKRVKDIFDQHDIRMTYPHLNIHLDK